MNFFEKIKIFFERIVKFFLWTAASFFVLVVILFVFFNLPGPPPRENVSFGVTFSSRFAKDLHLDPQKVLFSIFDDLGVRKIRIPVYWDTVEGERGVFDFSDIDWQLNLAKQYDAKVILAIGQKVPRWPECFVPKWADENESLRNEAVLRFIKTTIDRYRNHSEVVMWQIENEPFLAFGVCPPIVADVFDREISIAKKTDPSRPILTTDSGELSTWIPAASRGDVFGTTLYRRIWNKWFGYVTYPIGPNFFHFKEFFTRLFTNQKNFIVIELQAEPWTNGSFLSVPLEEQWKTMDEKKFLESIRYARQVGFSEVYLWGVEWWYWLKESKNIPDIWNISRNLF